MLKDIQSIKGIEEVRARTNYGNSAGSDSLIATMTPLEFTGAYTGWVLGHKDWADLIISVYEDAKKHEGEVSDG